MININTLYAKYDAIGAGTGGTISYYGYINQNQVSNPNPSDSSPVFSIKKVFWNNNVQSTVWSNNIIGAYESDWTNRASYFGTPSNVLTVTATSSFDGIKTNVVFSWNSCPGVSRYVATLNGGPNNKGITYLPDVLSSAVLNPENKSNRLVFINTSSCTLQNCLTGSSYNISIYPSNGYGVGTASTASIFV